MKWTYSLTIACLPCVLFPGTVTALADEVLDKALNDDVVLRATVDELERSTQELSIPGLPKPYFIEFFVQDQMRSYVDARLGSVGRQTHRRDRSIRTDVRVGSYELDNSNYQNPSGGFGGGGIDGADMPIEDDYHAIRQAIWWVADRDYKQVVEDLEAKKAFMASKIIESKPSDWSRETPTVHLANRIALSAENDSWKDLVIRLSAIFKDFPGVLESSVSADYGVENRYLVNSEGTRMRTPARSFTLAISATVQAADGMRLTGSSSVVAADPGSLPKIEELESQCRELAQQLEQVKRAPVLESYAGPVLFDPEAAAAIFATRFAGQFAGGQRPVGSRTNPDDFANKLNRRVLPTFLNVVDDPTLKQFEGQPLLSHYEFDDQAVAGRPLTLIEAGRLKALLMSRNPSKEFANSTGHGRGTVMPRAVVSTMLVTATPANTVEQMKQELIESALDEGLEFGLRVTALGNVGGGGGSGFMSRASQGGSSPLVMYKVFPDGREELVRGADISRIDLRAFKRILAAGDAPFIFQSGGATPRTVICPSLLFEELDLAKIDRDFDRPPILDSPLVLTK